MHKRIVASAPHSPPAGTAPRLVILPAGGYTATSLTGLDFRLMILLSLAGARKRALPITQDALCKLLHCDRRTVRDSITRLQSQDYLATEHNTRHDGVFHRIAYRLTF